MMDDPREPDPAAERGDGAPSEIQGNGDRAPGDFAVEESGKLDPRGTVQGNGDRSGFTIED